MEADPLDVAARLEESQRNAAIALTLMRPQETPDEDEHGRYCLDCGEPIPVARVAAIQAVRCVHCAQVREQKAKRISGVDIRRYLTHEEG